MIVKADKKEADIETDKMLSVYPRSRAFQAIINRLQPITRSHCKARYYAVIAEPLPHKSARSSDLSWVLAAAAVFVPTMAYLITSPDASHHSSTSHAHPVPDRWSRSMELEDLKSAKLNRPIIADDDGIVPAGEGRPHGPGDRRIRELTKPTETHADQQASMHRIESTKPIPEKMDQARAHSAMRTPHSTNIDTKAVRAKAEVDHQARHG